MKTKLTLLLALALSAPAFAEKPNFNGAKPATRAPAVRSVPALPSASRTVNVGQIMSITRSVLPKVTNAPQYQPRQAPPPTVPVKNATRPSVSTFKPAARNSIATKPGSLTRNPPAGVRSDVPNVHGGMDPSLASALAAGREIANGLKSLNSLRGSISGLREFGDVFHQPGNGGSGSRGNVTDPFASGSGSVGNREVKNPLDRFSSGRPRDIRGDMSNSRKGDGTTGLSRTGDAVLADETSMASGRDGTHTPVESTTHENGDVTASTTTTTRDGSTTSVEVTEHSDGSGTTTTTHGNDGRTDTITVTRRDSTGEVLWSSTDSVHEGGKQHRVTRDGSGRVTSDVTEYFSRSSRPRPDPSEGGSVAGPAAPSAKRASGLVPLDLLRQFANGESSNGGTNYLVRGIGGRQVNPGRDGGSSGPTNRVKTDIFGTISNPASHGGEGPLVGGNPPD